MSDRFFSPRIDGKSVTLTDAEAHHAIHVVRLKAGDSLQLFDGAGTTADGVVKEVGRRDLTVSVCSKSFREYRLAGRVTVAACLPKGDRLKWMVEKLTEIGVDRFIPLETQRSNAGLSRAKTEKLAMTVIAATKQCRRSWLMEIGEAQTFDDVLNRVDAEESLVMAHPAGAECDVCVPGFQNGSAIILIGPEGGFTAEEVFRAEQKSAVKISWPYGILRTETAAVVMAALVKAGPTLNGK